jgi:hypothetical protein
LVIKSVVKVIVCLMLAGGLAMTSSAQSTPATSSDSAAQTQSQDTAAPAGGTQTPSQTQPQTNPAGAQPANPSQGQSQGQAPAGQPTGNAPGQSQGQNKEDTPANGKVAGTSNDRLFYTLPNFLTLQTQRQLPPMSTGDKFKAVALGTFDYVQYPWWAILAAISQGTNGDPAYGQGWEAYAKRYGTEAGDSIVENFMVGAVFASMLRQDPRYYQSGQGSFFHRTGYAISRIFVTRADSGKHEFNYSEIFGAATAAAISTYTYHPRSTYLSVPGDPHKFIPSERTFSNVVSTWGTQVGLDTITLEVKEFWPDIRNKLSKKKTGAVPQTGSAAQASGVKP